MSKKITVDGSALIITDTISGNIEFEGPKKDHYFDYKRLLNDSVIEIYDTNAVNMAASGVIEFSLSECVDLNDITFTDTTFRAFARLNLGFNTSSGGSGDGSHGFFDYNDLATATTPISVSAGATEILVNDELGSFTNKNFPPPGVTDVWNASNSLFDFTELNLGSKMHYRIDIDATISGTNGEVEILIELAIGGTPYTLNVGRHFFKSSGTYNITIGNFVYMGDSNTLDNGGRFKVKCSNNTDVKVNGWACYITLY